MVELSGALCLAACLVVVSMEAGWGSARARLLLKSLASAAMVGFALACGAAGSAAGGCFVIGLVCSAAGDALLARSDEDFVRGLVAFLLAHLFYIAGFTMAGWSLVGVGFTSVLLLPVVYAVWGRLGPHAGPLKKPVGVYLVVISGMLLVAAGAVWMDPSPARQTLFLAAVGFGVSDLFVAEKRLRTPHWSHVTLGLPLYYLAQLGVGFGAAGL